MDSNFEKNNRVYLMGEIASEAKFSHMVYGEGFYEFSVKVPNSSGEAEILTVTMSERLIDKRNLRMGSTLAALGQIRCYYKLVEGKSCLMHTVFVREIVDIEPSRNPNSVVLMGRICEPPVFRTVPDGCEAAEFLLAVDRPYYKSDFIPCVAWGKHARLVHNLKVEGRIALSGRIRSREQEIGATTYEVFVDKLVDRDEEFDLYFSQDDGDS